MRHQNKIVPEKGVMGKIRDAGQAINPRTGKPGGSVSGGSQGADSPPSGVSAKDYQRKKDWAGDNAPQNWGASRKRSGQSVNNGVPLTLRRPLRMTPKWRKPLTRTNKVWQTPEQKKRRSG